MQAELRKEYQDVINQFRTQRSPAEIEAAVRACQALADRPPRELSDAEIEAISDKVEFSKFADDLFFARSCIAAFLAKQREPEREPLDLEKLKTGEWELYYNGFKTEGVMLAEFVANPHLYTMRRKNV